MERLRGRTIDCERFFLSSRAKRQSGSDRGIERTRIGRATLRGAVSALPDHSNKLARDVSRHGGQAVSSLDSPPDGFAVANMTRARSDVVLSFRATSSSTNNRRSVRAVDRVNQLTESAEAASMRRKNKPRKSHNLGLIHLLNQCFALHNRSLTQDIGKLFV